MKKPKSSQQKPILPISLSSKKNETPSKTVEGLFTPYKIDWRNPSTRACNINLQKPAPLRESNQQSRSFFSAMKTQLSNIKNDVEKLIKKDVGMDEKAIRNAIMNSNSIKKNDSPVANQRNKKCSSFTFNQNFELSGVKKSTQGSNCKEANTKKSNQVLVEIDSKQQQKLTLLQNKMICLESQNQQIIKKLLLLQKKLSNKTAKTSQDQEYISKEIKRIMPQITGMKSEELNTSFQNKGSERIMEILQSRIQVCESVVQRNSQKLINSQSMICTSKQTQKLQEKIEMFESQMDRLQAIILDLEKRNQQSAEQKELVCQELKKQRQKSQKINASLNQQSNIHQNALSQIKRLQSIINKLQSQIKQASKPQQKGFDIQSKQISQQNDKLIGQIRILQISYKQLQTKFDQNRKQLDKYKVKQNYYATQLAKEREKNKGSSSFTQQKDQTIRQLRETVEAIIKQKNDILVQWENEVGYYKKQLQHVKNVYQTDHQKSGIIMKKTDEMQDYITKLELQIEQRTKSYEMSVDQQENYIKNLQKQIDQSQTKNDQLIQKNQQIARQIQQVQKELQRTRNEKASQNAKSLGKQFEDKINQAYDQIYSLKRKLTYSQNQLHQFSVQKKSLEQALRLYQQRDKQQEYIRNSKGYKASQYDSMSQKIEQLTRQNEELRQKYEVTVMKMENEIDSLRQKSKSKHPNEVESQKNINAMLKQQLQETGILRIQLKQKHEQIYKLKGQVKEKSQKINILNDRLSIANLQKLSAEQSLKQSRNSQSSNGLQPLQKDLSSSSITIQSQLELIKKKQESSEKILQVKTRELKMKDEFITNALIGKINKKDSQDQINYLIKQLERITKKHFFH